MREALIVSLQIFPVGNGGLRVDMVSPAPPRGESPAFESMVLGLERVAEAVITNHGPDLLGSHSLHIEGCPASPQQKQTQGEASRT